jgi:hypothetical protein
LSFGGIGLKRKILNQNKINSGFSCCISWREMIYSSVRGLNPDSGSDASPITDDPSSRAKVQDHITGPNHALMTSR